MLTLILAGTQAELEQCLHLRRAVFCVEKGVSPELERDEWDVLDAGYDHILILSDETPVGALRCRHPGGGTVQLQRFCILREYRKGGLGRQAVRLIEGHYRQNGIQHIELDAKFEVHGFYEKCGYQTIGQPFEEAGIPHIKMSKCIAND